MSYNEWMDKLTKEHRIRKNFRNRCEQVDAIYSDNTTPYDSQNEDPVYDYNILWVNCNVYLAALFSRNPKPDVRRRYKDDDPTAKDIAIVLERALTFMQDTQDYYGNGREAVLSFIKCGLGQMRLRYNPYHKEVEGGRKTVFESENGYVSESGELVEEEVSFDDDGNAAVDIDATEELEHEDLLIEWIPANHFRWEPNPRWEDVSWCAIEHYLTKEEVEEQFPDKASKIPISYSEEGIYMEQDKKDTPTRALIYEIFDKRNKKVITYAKGLMEVVKEEKDPWGFADFYPFPKPMFATMGDDGINPVPDYEYYKAQHSELNTITDRINKLHKVVKYRGFYDGAIAKIIDVSAQDDGDFTALDNYAQLAAMNGGTFDINKHIAAMPIAEATTLLDRMYGWREQTKNVIYEITGISDIIRGSTVASETLGAQQLKSQFANLRLQPKTKEVERFFRDIMRLSAEFMSEKYEASTLSEMTGMEVTQEMTDIMGSDTLRQYTVDVETDSTALEDSAEEQRTRTEALTALSTMMQQFMPLMQMGVDKKLIGEMILFGLKGFKGSRELEDTVQAMLDEGNTNGAIPGPAGMGGVPVEPGPQDSGNVQAFPIVGDGGGL